MTWIEKERQLPLDQQPIEGLFYLDGNLHEGITREYTWGTKSPMIAFPSGEVHEVVLGDIPQVHVFAEMDLPLFDTRDAASERALALMNTALFSIHNVLKVDDNQLVLYSAPTGEICLITYDNEQGRMIDVERASIDNKTL